MFNRRQLLKIIPLAALSPKLVSGRLLPPYIPDKPLPDEPSTTVAPVCGIGVFEPSFPPTHYVIISPIWADSIQKDPRFVEGDFRCKDNRAAYYQSRWVEVGSLIGYKGIVPCPVYAWWVGTLAQLRVYSCSWLIGDVAYAGPLGPGFCLQKPVYKGIIKYIKEYNTWYVDISESLPSGYEVAS